ncbi:TetR family transcriptional regulator [Streptomyces sp. NPDC005773]|uniref:TetR family transcriptional regulator n=1 Tax=Streptomyces sp. NPDC005773 TaxID=3364727 RepID=UPI003691B38B
MTERPAGPYAARGDRAGVGLRSRARRGGGPGRRAGDRGAVTTDAVAARAGVSKPAVQRRWPTEQDLIIAAAETRIGVLSVPVRAASAPGAPLRAATDSAGGLPAARLGPAARWPRQASADPGAARSHYAMHIGARERARAQGRRRSPARVRAARRSAGRSALTAASATGARATRSPRAT